MEKNNYPPPYGWNGNSPQVPPSAPPSYSQAVGGVGPSSPYTPQYHPSSGPTIVTTVVPVGPQPTHMICPSCHSEINTDTQTKPGIIAYISGAVIFMLGGFLGCCLIPCCIDSCMDVHHTCPHCDAYLGRYRR
ncbi:LITAF domain-containing protein [Bicyclus anynana]|uniref:LITAF domain-containing protein n=1 Tax=Bicyclus anynana TaxID=110368 RepID=A0A6J1P7Z5_BICAN|nr:LITAF domain-containing protein [Bicyclus anynana]XP_052746426.1 LITAF domain-containing protein [Bicyclus anynana]XP_052746427.1 LITAF domain-containing protein [Bicyclus anynana]